MHQNVIRTLLYYDIFNYPLNTSEVFRFLGINSITEKDVGDSLRQLAEKKIIFRFGDYYSMQPTEVNVARRIKGNREAEKFMTLAQSRAHFIARFPFVRAVFASGSLSKGYMDEKSDLDFFIITKPGRLWIARTLLVLYKRIFLGNSHKHFCVNYFVDYNHLEIEEKNIFTATELATVIPLSGNGYYEKLVEANAWIKKLFPNFRAVGSPGFVQSKTSFLKKNIERCIDFTIGNALEKFFMQLTFKRWKKIYGKSYSQTDFAIAFKTKKYVSKNHPNHYQRKVMELYAQKLSDFSTRHVFRLD